MLVRFFLLYQSWKKIMAGGGRGSPWAGDGYNTAKGSDFPKYCQQTSWEIFCTKSRRYLLLTEENSKIKIWIITRTKTSIRYAKENDREKREREGERKKERERKKGRRRDIEREGEIREIEIERDKGERDREAKGIERWKG